LLANANKTLRLPSFTDIYYSSASQKGNPDIGLEKSLNFDLGAEYKTGQFSAAITAFMRKTADEIDWIKHKSTDSTIWRAANYNEQKTGVEINAGYKTNAFLKSIQVGYSYIYSDKDLGNYMSKYVLDFVKHKVVTTAVFDLSRKLTLGVTGIYWDRNGLYVDARKTTRSYSPYATLDAQLTWTEKSYTIKLSGTNLTDTRFFDIGGLRQAGTWITGGIVVKLQ
jgi:iron complex outermembrane receptor protein